MTWRDMGKANFIDVRDASDRMQVYVRMNDIGEDAFKEFKTWDIGDIVGVEGFVFRTKTGEISVHGQMRHSYIELEDGTTVWGRGDFDAEDMYGTVVYSKRTKEFLGGRP